MSFSFAFADGEAMDEDPFGTSSGAELHDQNQGAGSSRKPQEIHAVPSQTLELEHMLQGLPDRISYSFVCVPVLSADGKAASSSASAFYLPRRDLFDARFQMLHDDSEDEGETESSSNITKAEGSRSRKDERGAGASREEDGAVVGTESDLIPGLYEGGLKTWECSVDLVGVLESMSRLHGSSNWLRRRRIVELGCGTALPTVHILQSLLARQQAVEVVSDTDTPAAQKTHLHLCDFNSKVLELVTLPNLLLAYHVASAEPRSQDEAPIPGDLDLTPEFLKEFQTALHQAQIELHFHSGPWDGLDLAALSIERTGDPPSISPPVTADLILTSETTYNLEGIRSLVATLDRLSCPQQITATAATSLPTATDVHQMLLGSPRAAPSSRASAQAPTLSLVSTKDYYFGLGGGIVALRNTLAEYDAASTQAAAAGSGRQRDDSSSKRSWLSTVREFPSGVARSVLCLGWTATTVANP